MTCFGVQCTVSYHVLSNHVLPCHTSQHYCIPLHYAQNMTCELPMSLWYKHIYTNCDSHYIISMTLTLLKCVRYRSIAHVGPRIMWYGCYAVIYCAIHATMLYYPLLLPWVPRRRRRHSHRVWTPGDSPRPARKANCIESFYTIMYMFFFQTPGAWIFKGIGFLERMLDLLWFSCNVLVWDMGFETLKLLFFGLNFCKWALWKLAGMCGKRI